MLELDEHLHRLERCDFSCWHSTLLLVNGDVGPVFCFRLAGWSVGRVEGGEAGEEQIYGVDLDDLSSEDERNVRGMEERTKHLYICFSRLALAIFVNPEETDGGGASSTGRKSLKNLLMDNGPMKHCRISSSNAMRSAWTRRGGDAEQSAEVCCVFLTGVDSRGFSKATDR